MTSKRITNPAAKKNLRQDRPRAVICLTNANSSTSAIKFPHPAPEHRQRSNASKSTDPFTFEMAQVSQMAQPEPDQSSQTLNTDLFEPPTWLVNQVTAQMPKWAPQALVKELLLYRMTGTESGKFARCIFEYPEDEQAMLERVLTQPGMNIVWKSIQTACENKGIRFDDFVRQLWRQLATANAVLKQTTKTPSETRAELEEIIHELRLSLRKIERNRIAKILNRRAIHELTAKKLARSLPSSDHPLFDQIRMEARINDDVLSTLADGSNRRSAVRQSRLAEALSASVSLSLTDVATHMIGELEQSINDYKGEVKELGNQAPVFIRRIRGLLKDTFGKPMASTVAALLNVALDREFGDITEELVRKTR